MKNKWLILAAALLVITGTAFSGTREFKKGRAFLTPQVGINSYAVPFGVNYEYGITKNIGIGGTVMYYGWSDTYWTNKIISFSADGAYHFTKLRAEKFDLAAGASLGFSSYSYKWKAGYSNGHGKGSSGLRLEPFVNARYFLSPKIALNLRVLVDIVGDWTGLSGLAGVSFVL